jgi:hypothetical protein
MLGDEIDIRMLVPMSAFTIHSDATPLELLAHGKHVLNKIVIPADAKKGL